MGSPTTALTRRRAARHPPNLRVGRSPAAGYAYVRRTGGIRMSRTMAGLALPLIVLFSSVRPASATSCGRVDPTVEQILQSDAVFTGRVIDSGYGLRPASCIAGLFAALLGSNPPEQECVPCVLEFRVIERFKGVFKDTVLVDLGLAPQCSSWSSPESRQVSDMLVFASRIDGGRLAIDLCWGYLPTSTELLTELRARQSPDH